MSATQEQLVDRRFKEWESRTNRKVAPAKAVEKVVTITGEYGAMGNTVADLVSKELGFTLYDRKLIHMIAERAHVEPSIVEAVEKREHTYLTEIFDELIGNVELGDSEYAKRLSEVVGLVGANGAAVILGRGANVLLGSKRALRVRCIAPDAVRVNRIADRLNLSRFEASEAMAVEDARRAHWVESMVGVDLNYPGHYDIIINTDTFSLESAAKAIVAAYRS